jgi:hypothetical protein
MGASDGDGMKVREEDQEERQAQDLRGRGAEERNTLQAGSFKRIP